MTHQPLNPKSILLNHSYSITSINSNPASHLHGGFSFFIIIIIIFCIKFKYSFQHEKTLSVDKQLTFRSKWVND